MTVNSFIQKIPVNKCKIEEFSFVIFQYDYSNISVKLPNVYQNTTKVLRNLTFFALKALTCMIFSVTIQPTSNKTIHKQIFMERTQKKKDVN